MVCLEKATDTAIKLYRWGNECNANSLAMEDIRFFVTHTPIWCHDKAPEDLANSFTDCQQYAECKKCIDDIVL